MSTSWPLMGSVAHLWKQHTFKKDDKKKRLVQKEAREMNVKDLGLVWKLLFMNTLSCGLEASVAVGTIYIPPLLLRAGMEERYMTMVLAMSPALGLIFTPMIGSASDSRQGRFGRRRPFIWMLSLGVLLGLQIIPQAHHLAVLISPQYSYWLEVAFLVVAVCLLDFCGHACLTMLVTLLSDLFPNEEENHKAFSVNSLMTSLGGCLGFFLPSMDWSQAPLVTYLGGQEAFVCALLASIFLGCLLTTVFITEGTGTTGGERKTNPLKSRGSGCCRHLFLPPQYFPVALQPCASACKSAIYQVYTACERVPTVIWRLFMAETCSWMSLMSVMLFFAEFMGEGLYKGVPSAAPESEEKRQYDEGVRVASLGLFLQCVVSVLCSALMHFWVALLGARVVYISGVALLVFATTIMTVSESVTMVTIMVAATGYTLGVLQVLPYTLLCLYHSNKQTYFTSSNPRPRRDHVVLAKNFPTCGPDSLCPNGHTGTPSLPGTEPSVGSSHVSLTVAGGDRAEANCTQVSQRGICFDMAILDSAYLLSQVLPAMCLGSIVQLSNSVRTYMASAFCFGLLALLCSTKVVFSHHDL
uniref:solute carrier family 45 member 3 n=1 Tax=Scatophagus argus TaxID=75038 RepID=UPI001ED7DF8B|nr:solute carrier family 45 member 3 [Scatophagus argus]